jgi:hypothetical protein
MNVLELLHQDHQTVSRLFSQLLTTPSTDRPRREQLFQTLKSELLRHSRVEEMLARMEAIPADSDDWQDAVEDLASAFRHHVEEEDGD